MKPGKHGDAVRALALVLQLGLTVLTPAGLLLALGLWLDGRYGWSSTLPLLILGILGGAKGAYSLAKRVIGPPEKDDD